jgi:hypothetical protein
MTDVIVRPGPLAKGSDRRAVMRFEPSGSAANQAARLASFGEPLSSFAAPLPGAIFARRRMTPIACAARRSTRAPAGSRRQDATT